jgi:carboxypeptidase Taq
MEKKFINEGLTVEEAPAMWNKLYEEYLGITPPTDSVGILQDVHWAYGNMGYFPTYALGNMYGAQMYHTLRQEMPAVDEYIAAGNLAPIREWLTEKVYQYGGARKPQELIVAITGEELNPDYLADYLEHKYKEIYRLG